MPRLEKIEPGEVADGFADTARVAPPSTNGNTPQLSLPVVSDRTLSFDLAKGKGKATFRYPTAQDLDQAEQEGSFVTSDGVLKICRKLAESTCICWGELPAMPAPNKIRRQDGDRRDMLFADLLRPAHTNPDIQELLSYSRVIDGGSTRDDGFDAYEVTLTNGDRLLFDEPSQADSDKKQRAKTFTSGMWIFAANLLRKWGKHQVTIDGEFTVIEAIDRIKKLPIDDFLRVSAALSSFRD